MSTHHGRDSADVGRIDSFSPLQDAAPLHFSGHVVSPAFVHGQPQEPAGPNSLPCMEFSIGQGVRSSTRPAARIVSRVVERSVPEHVVEAARSEVEDGRLMEPHRPLLALPAPVASTPMPIAPRTDPDGPPPGHELRKFHRLMRGRYKWAILLALVAMCGGGYGGFRIGQKIYQSTGAIQVKAVVTTAMQGDTGVLPMFDSYVESQAAKLRSERVRDLALQSPEWKALNRGNSEEVSLEFADNLTVVRQGEIISVSATDPDPDATQIAVRTIINAYRKIFEGEDALDGEKRLRFLEERQLTLNGEVGRIRSAIKAIATEHKTDDLQSLYSAQLARVAQLETAVNETQLELTALEQDPAAIQRRADELTLEQMASTHQGMQRLLAERGDAERRLRQLELTIGEGNPELPRARRALEKVVNEIEALAPQVRQEFIKGQGNVAQAMNASAADLEDRLRRFREQRQAADQELTKLNNNRITLEEYRDQAATAQAKLDETQRALDRFRLNKPFTGRIEIGSEGDRPRPYKDTRVTFAAAGGMGGGAIGFALVVLLALTDRRLRTPDDATEDGSGIPMLGLLPKLPSDLSDPAQAATAAHCVHEIRTLLQIRGHGRDHRVFAVTSSQPAAGKTSLTLALGTSFALAGHRTLIIDSDLVAGGLTTRVQAIIRRRIGYILRREGMITELQLEQALRLAHGSARRLGEMLVELGHLTEHDLARAIMLQENEDPLGVLDALAGSDLRECVTEIGIENLWALPVGVANARHVPTLSPEGLSRVIQAARAQFDIVLIDTGPILGSLEASLVTSLADGAILTVTKGEQKPLIQRSIAQLTSVGARLMGVVFNRASEADVSFHSSSHGSARYSRTSGSVASSRLTPHATPALNGFGPLAQAVASFAPISGYASADDVEKPAVVAG